MDMAAKFQDQRVFHMTGNRAGDGLVAVDIGSLRPALLAGYRDLTRLRYDFPLVLPDTADGGEYVHSLSSVVTALLTLVAPRGIEGERLRKHVLRLERELRTMVAAGESGTLSELWARAAERISAGADATVAQVLAKAGGSLPVDGEIADCDPALPVRMIKQAWRHAHAQQAREFRTLVDTLIRKLSDIRRAAFARSAAGQQPVALAASIGGGHADVFDFSVMSKLVARSAPKDELPPARRQRIEWALGVLGAQPFYADPDDSAAAGWDFVFEDCAAAAAAYRERLPRLAEVVKAIAMAELEAKGAYVEADHDAFFERYGENALTADDLALFPNYLVCIPAGRNDAPENAGLIEMLSSGLPVKVLVQQTDLLEEASIGTGHFAFGVRSTRLATTAMGLGGMFVLQATSADLYAMRARIERGLACRGPALFSVFAGSPAAAGDLPPYLTAAAAREARAFPAFVYDAAAGPNWATRFSLEHNRNPDADWPADVLEYSDEAVQRVREDTTFSYVDFALCDRRYIAHFAVVPRGRWNAAMLPAADWLALDERAAADRVPYVWAVDAEDRLHRVIVDARLMQAARRCLLLWHRLQEHAGIHDSHAERLLAKEKAAWEAEHQQAREEVGQAAPAATTAGAAAAAAATAPVAEAEAAKPTTSDEAWIETSRCPSCNECQNINDRMFAYNENKQAYIKDITAGTYRQLVEAAEVCQVAIIHPGKPRNPNEPGLEELIERAKPFL
jgi:predicted dithiol-disulfide oxidoreductase (DUF899 family)